MMTLQICPGQSVQPEDPLRIAGEQIQPTTTTLYTRSPAKGNAEVELVENDLVMVHLIDGSIFPNARIEVDWDYMVLIVQTGNRAPRNISFEKVESIINMQGQDITEEVLREYASPNRSRERSIEGTESSGEVQSDPEPLRPDRYHRKKLPWKFGITISPTYPFLFGTWYEGIKPDVGARLLVSLGVSKEVAVEFGYQYQPLRLDDEFQDDLGDLPGLFGASSGSGGIRIRVDKFFFGPRYLGKARDAPLWGYGSFGFGG